MPADRLDFYIVMYAQFASKTEVWLVYRDQCKASCCVGSYGTRAQATEGAMAMARYQAESGRPARVRIQADPASQQRWLTVWCSSDAGS